ncbi:MAG TPA: hypothetical protein VFH51_00635 [Myxococcota bacterium]|nr:hypothetical protein [Myxococcota bacterium]
MSYDSFLPALDLVQFADETRKLMGYKMFYAGFSIVAVGLLGKQMANLARTMRSQDADFITPIVVAAGFFALLANYKFFVASTVAIVSKLGLTTMWDDNIVTVFVQRARLFNRWQNEHSSFKAFALEYLVGFLYMLVETWVVFMRAAQRFILAVIVTYGPLLLGVASLGGALTTLGIGWFWALIEVSAWSVTMDILLMAYAKVPPPPRIEDLSVHAEFAFAFTLLGLLVAIPIITSSLIRGSSASVISVGFSAASRVTSVLATSRYSRSAERSATQSIKAGYGWIRDRVGRGGGDTSGGGGGPKASPQSAWKAAEAISHHRESRATAARSQGFGDTGPAAG